MAMPKVTIIGPGVVGRSLGRLLREQRFRIAAVYGPTAANVRSAIEFIGAGKAARSPAAAARMADVVLLTTPDRVIRMVCEQIAAQKGFKRGSVVFHCSGAHSASLLEAARGQKAHIGVLHPLQSFASAEAAVKRLRGTYFTFDGDEEAAEAAEKIVAALGGRMLRIRPECRALYHAATCVLSNYMVAIVDLGMNMMTLSGLERTDAAEAVKPLLRGTLENIATLDVPAALTGPIARGDAETVESHLKALEPLPEPVRRLYRELGLYTVRVAQRKGTLKPPEARRIVRLLS